MENFKINKKIGTCIGIAVLLILIGILIALTFGPKEKEVSEKTQIITKAEEKNLSKFNEKMEEAYKKAATMELPDAKEFLVDSIHENAELYGGNDSVDYLANQLLNEILNSIETKTTELVNDVDQKSEEISEQLLDGILGKIDENVIVKNLTIKSETVCTDGDIDAKFCVNKLNAKAYIIDENSDKWAVVVHPFLTSGSLMYRTVGYMYTEQGYNVLAPDLRGFGSSDGSVAMGYLEALDIYDWLKDLNLNYSKKNRYGVKKAPTTIVVHGMSLGGATTLQLATNPDIAAAKKAPYTKTLTELNVKTFVDDCGYTSMSGIITGMLGSGDLSQLTSIFESLGINKEQFMAEFSKLTESLKIKGFEEFDISQLENLKPEEIDEYFEKFNQIYQQVETEFKKYEQSNGEVTIPGYDKETMEEIIDNLKEKLPTDIELPEDYEDAINNLIPKNTNNTLNTEEFSTTLNKVVGKVLMTLVGVGLNDDNYDYYSNSFAPGRQFPEGSKIVIIHGTIDTTVPYSNATEVANNTKEGTLIYKWDVKGAPHAFVLLGMNKEEYVSLVADIATCSTNDKCISITK